MNLSFVSRAYVLDVDNNVLLVRHHADSPWVLPWGHIEKNENPARALRREIKEELGVGIEILWIKNATTQDECARRNVCYAQRCPRAEWGFVGVALVCSAFTYESWISWNSNPNRSGRLSGDVFAKQRCVGWIIWKVFVCDYMVQD